MKLYENIVVGNFLYALGFSIGQKAEQFENHQAIPIVNLLQQTPDDARLADLFMAAESTIRIIEFKRKENKDDKEKIKLEKLTNVVLNEPEIENTSRRIHWYIESSATNNTMETRIVPYLDAISERKSCYGFFDFINITADALLSRGNLAESGLNSYLEIMSWCHRENSNNRISSTPQGGSLIIQFDKVSNGLKCANVTSFLDLIETRQQIFERMLKEHDTNEHSITQSRGR